VHVKALTLRGFKSFASATSLRFEPGITCVVGPNGAGKSNIVDAFSWVMGEQGAKSLRGGKMDDVVFAGTTSRPPLGRAEVTLTIDNTDGMLPIDYTEVTISRLLFRSGQSEYAINGNHCRLLDVAELLSDSGLGREMHVIVGQGQLDEVLHAGPEARRALIEEAAGVLKHRRRKEKALRKLEAMQANLTRLVDLTSELRRRLGPLGRQAAIARQAAAIQADLRDARLRLLADDYVAAAAAAERGETDEAATAARRADLDRELRAARAREAELDAGEQEHAPRLARAQETWFALAASGERLRGLARVAQERARHLAAESEPLRLSRDPDELDLEAAQLREQESVLGERLAVAREALADAVRTREAAEAELASLQRQRAMRARAEAERAERLAGLRAEVGAARSRKAAAQEEVERLSGALTAARSRAESLEREYAEFGAASAGLDRERAALTAAHEDAVKAVRAAGVRVAECRAAERRLNGERAALAARADALEEAIRSVAAGTDAAAALLADPQWSGAVLGAVAALLTVEDGAQHAITAALGGAADAVAVAGLDAAVAIVGKLKADDAGSAGFLIADAPGGATARTAAGPPDPFRGGSAPPAAQPAIDLVRAPGELSAAVASLLADVVVTDDLSSAHDVLSEYPWLRVVTRDGDLLGAHWAQGGSPRPASALAMRASADETASRLRRARSECEAAAADLAAALAQEQQAQAVLSRALERRQAADSTAAQTSGTLGRLAGAARAAREEASRLEAAISAARATSERDAAALAHAADQLARAEAEGAAAEGPPSAGDAAVVSAGLPGHEGERESELLLETAGEAAMAAREAETEARLEVRTVEERLSSIAGRADTLADAAQRERQAARRAREHRLRREHQARLARAVAQGAEVALAHLSRSLDVADAQRLAATAASQGRSQALKQVRGEVRDLAAELDKVVNAAHGAEMARAEHRMRLEQIVLRAVEEFGVEPEVLASEYGPGAGVPVAGDGDEEQAQPATVPYVRQEQERRAASAQRKLDQLGKVNPLALEEFAALEERHAFLAAQLEDLKKTRRDLLTVVKEVDQRVQEVFAAAFEDTAREFEAVFARLFPGGEGRLVLTEPDDMLATGIDVEARPPGKKVKRLSLLSGGERSLTAIAYLVAIFKARPSPFYVLDEVEAALDDANIHRLLGVFEELRESSQLIIVTHQKRTMEVADALYGITMGADGVSNVVSQRLREPERA
jgi:chromosome segregation protein